MTQDFNEYLAVHVLNEQEYVTYRSLSRALKVHCNLAKQMLWEFHHKQSAKTRRSVHATYLITGYRTSEREGNVNGVHSQEGDDAAMLSSPPLSMSSAAKPDDTDSRLTMIRSIIVVKEEQLDQAKATFDKITGMHVYSLQPKGLSDVQGLTECNRKIAADYASEDPLQTWKQYGTIHNPNVRKRARKTPLPSVAAAKGGEVKGKPAAPAAPASKPAVPDKQTTKATSDSTSRTLKSISEPSKDTSTKAAPKPAVPKRESSGIFKSFAKGANKSTKAPTDNSTNASPAPPAPPEDEAMGGMSDDDQDVGANDAEVEVKAPSGKSKKDRQAELKAMMDAHDEEMEDAVGPDKEKFKEEEADVDAAEPQPDEGGKEDAVVENGRRRGKRKVMKKKTVRDEEGYLVTKEEPVWEDFSEEEAAPKKPKVAASVPPAVKGGKKGSKPGQGNIMSFFSKK